jgi:hypothetical protein
MQPTPPNGLAKGSLSFILNDDGRAVGVGSSSTHNQLLSSVQPAKNQTAAVPRRKKNAGKGQTGAPRPPITMRIRQLGATKSNPQKRQATRPKGRQELVFHQVTFQAQA